MLYLRKGLEVFRKYLRELIKTNLVLDKLNLFFFLHQAKTIPFIFVIFAKNYILVNLFHIMRLDVPFLFYCCWFDFDFVLKDRVWGRQFSQSQFALFFFELHYPPFINPIITENAVFWTVINETWQDHPGHQKKNTLTTDLVLAGITEKQLFLRFAEKRKTGRKSVFLKKTP